MNIVSIMTLTLHFGHKRAATSIPSFANMDATSRRALIEEVASDTFTAVQGFVEGGALVFDMSTNVVVMS